jgi:hypothetical protein
MALQNEMDCHLQKSEIDNHQAQLNGEYHENIS